MAKKCALIAIDEILLSNFQRGLSIPKEIDS